MKYVLYALFIISGLILIYFLKIALDTSNQSVEIVGSDKCGRCHGLNNIGNQYSKWENERHSKAYLTLCQKNQ